MVTRQNMQGCGGNQIQPQNNRGDHETDSGVVITEDGDNKLADETRTERDLRWKERTCWVRGLRETRVPDAEAIAVNEKEGPEMDRWYGDN
jgi:hypothetical protein